LDQKWREGERVDSLFVQMEFMPFTPSFAQLRVRVRERERERESESRERTAFEEEHQNSLLFPSHTYICMPVGVHLAARMSAPHALLMEFNK
jgi:hypothetical protein